MILNKENMLITKNGQCVKEIYLKKHNIMLYDEVIKYNLKFDNIIWICRVYNFINKIIEIPKCPVCNNNLNFISFKFGYRKYCSIKCAINSPEFKANKENTMIKKYGVKNPSQLETVKKKKIETLQKNYGVTHPLKSDIIKERAAQTNIKNWGVKNVSQSNIVNEKKKTTTLKNYGVEYTFQSEEIKNKIVTTIRDKYNVDHYVESDENRLLIKNNMCLKRKSFWAKYFNIDISNIIISGNTITIKNLCEIHDSFNINRYNLYNRTIVYQFENICTICNPISENASVKENEIRDFIENELKIKTEKIKINNKEIDIYISDNKLGIEFNGLYWHSDLHKDNDYHLNKTKLCEEKGIQLLHIFEDEWIHKKEIVKSIIRSKLDVIINEISIIECQIVKIDNKTCKNFLTENHIEGHINSKIKIGLLHNNELVFIMCFNKINNGKYELLRYCNKLNNTITNGANELLKYFTETYHPKIITTLVDRRYSQGNLYKQLGFSFIKNIKPKYFYFKMKEMIRYGYFDFKKNLLIKEGFDSSKTEFEIMEELGYTKIHDCGYMKFEVSLAF